VLTGLRNRSAGLRVALMLLDVRHGLNLPVKMHALCQRANKFSRYDATVAALAGTALCR
jgi:hypothetical protein